jgi:uncharacterized membrane protein (DUF441 family)
MHDTLELKETCNENFHQNILRTENFMLPLITGTIAMAVHIREQVLLWDDLAKVLNGILVWWIGISSWGKKVDYESK